MKLNRGSKARTKLLLVSALASVAALALALAVALGASSPAQASSAVKKGGTLRIEQPWGTIPANFSPFVSAGQNAGGTLSCIYEQLFFLNTATSKTVPVLGTSYKWSNKNKTLVIKIRKGVKWSDGKSLTNKDVAFTFNYLKKNKALDLGGIWAAANSLKSVKTATGNAVKFTFSKPNTPSFVFISGAYVVPQHIWASKTSPATDTNLHPVGSGPFLLSSHTLTTVIYKKNTHYWMKGRPYIDRVAMTAVKSNDTALLDIMKGNTDIVYDAITNPAKTYSNKNANNKYWWPVTNINFLYFNTKKAPFADPKLRKALAWAMDTKKQAQRAYYGAIPAATGGAESGIVQGQLKTWYPKSLKSLEWTYNVAKSKSLLKAAGYKWVGDKLASSSGSVYPTFDILIGGPGWTDYIVQADLVSQQLKAVGISSNVVQQPWGTYSNAFSKGLFDMLICWGVGPGPTPYYLYYNMLRAPLPIGQDSLNYARYSNSTIAKALKTYAASSDMKVQKKAIATIAKSVLTTVPYVGLTGRPNFYDYQTRTFTGFPSHLNPYTAGDANDQPGSRLVFLNVHKK